MPVVSAGSEECEDDVRAREHCGAAENGRGPALCRERHVRVRFACEGGRSRGESMKGEGAGEGRQTVKERGDRSKQI